MSVIKQLLYFATLATLSSAQTTIPQIKHKLLLADEGNGKIHYIDLNNSSGKWSAPCSNRDMQLIGNDRLLVGDNGGSGFSILSLADGKVIRHVAISGVTGGVNSIFCKSGNEFFCARDGSPAKIYRVDSTGKPLSTITLAVGASVRICRPTPAGTFLVGGKVAGMMYEFDAGGKKIWECSAGGEPYMALRLPNGTTLISNGYGAQLVLADKQGAVIKKFPTEADLKNDASFWSAATPDFFGGFQILANGTIIVSNWQGHGAGHGASGYQLIEIDSTLGKVAGYWKQDASIVSSLHGVLVLDNVDSKNAYTDINGVLEPIAVVSRLQYGRIVPGTSTKSTGRREVYLFDLLGRSGKLSEAGGVQIELADRQARCRFTKWIDAAWK